MYILGWNFHNYYMFIYLFFLNTYIKVFNSFE